MPAWPTSWCAGCPPSCCTIQTHCGCLVPRGPRGGKARSESNRARPMKMPSTLPPPHALWHKREQSKAERTYFGSRRLIPQALGFVATNTIPANLFAKSRCKPRGHQQIIHFITPSRRLSHTSSICFMAVKYWRYSRWISSLDR